MAMDTVTGRWNGESPVSGNGGVSGGDAGERGFAADDWAVGEPAGARRRRPHARGPGRPGGAVVCAGSHAPDLHGSRLSPRGRLVVAAIWLVMAAVAALMLATVPGDSGQGPSVTTKVMVEPGETLWDLAAQVRPAAERQETVAAIMSLNDLESAAEVRAGDVLVVPARP